MTWPDPETYAYMLKRASTWCTLWLEQIAHAFWPLLTFTALILSLWLLNVQAVLPAPGAKILLITAIIGVGFFGYRGYRHLHMPGMHTVDRRMEQDAELPHRPFDVLEDKPAAAGNARTHALWLENRRRLQNALHNLRFAWPHTQLARCDPRALRIASILLLVTAAFIAGPHWQQRLTSGLLPFQWQEQLTAGDNIIIWVQPPDYTGIGQKVIKGGAPETRLKIPAGSDIKIRLKGGLGTPYLDTGTISQAFDRQEGGNYAIETQLPANTKNAEKLSEKQQGTITVSQLFYPRANIPYVLLPDQEPEIRFNKGQDTLKDASLRFHLGVRDDYGIDKLDIDVTPAPSQSRKAQMPEIGTPVHRTRSLHIAGSEDYQDIDPVFDLSAHPWAGRDVIIRFTAYDAAGQTTRTSPIRITLPQRKFTHPVAQRLIDYRRELIDRIDSDKRKDIRYGLSDLARMPKRYQGDITVFLAMRSAASRLRYSPGLDTRKALVDLLWATALRIEDGDYPFAERNLRQSGRELEKTLNNPDASDEDIARAMRDYQQALSQYMKALQKKLRKQANSGEMQVVPSQMLKDTMQPQDMRSMLEKMRAQALSGDREQARKQLSKMRRKVDQMNSAMQQKIPEDIQKTAQGMKDLQSLINDQKDLHKRTQKAGKPQKSTQQQGPKQGAQKQGQDAQQKMAGQQGALAQKLQSLMDDLPGMAGSARTSLTKAEKAMQNAKQALQAGKTGKAAGHQKEALKHMRQSGQKMAQAMRKRLSKMSGIALGRGGARDPLGRRRQQGDMPNSGDTVEVPIEGEQRPIHELIELLRGRAGELERPRQERDYYRRLLEQWQ